MILMMILVSVLTVMIVIIMMISFFCLLSFCRNSPPDPDLQDFDQAELVSSQETCKNLKKKTLGSRRLESSIRDKPSFGTRVWLDMIQNEQKIS